MIEWKLQGHVVAYEDESHSYFVDGVRAISVTQLLQHKFKNKYANVSKEVLSEKAKAGTRLHEDIEIYEEYGLEATDSLEFRNYLFLKDKFKWKTLNCEVPILIDYCGFYICGRLDQVQELDGKLGLADIKHTATLDKDYLACQLNLYSIGYMQSYPNKRIEFLKAIHLNGSKRKYQDIPINVEYACEVVNEFLKENRNGK